MSKEEVQGGKGMEGWRCDKAKPCLRSQYRECIEQINQEMNS